MLPFLSPDESLELPSLLDLLRRLGGDRFSDPRPRRGEGLFRCINLRGDLDLRRGDFDLRRGDRESLFRDLDLRRGELREGLRRDLDPDLLCPLRRLSLLLDRSLFL